jgi:hypothetical protein
MGGRDHTRCQEERRKGGHGRGFVDLVLGERWGCGMVMDSKSRRVVGGLMGGAQVFHNISSRARTSIFV